MSKKNAAAIACNLAALMEPAAPKAEPITAKDAPGTKAKGNYKTVCYSIPPDLAEQIKRAAYIDRKTIGAVVAEAFEMYLQQWEPMPEPSKQQKI